MALKKEPEKHPNHERWLVSYGDFITLLFAVFVTMYAMSQSDKKKVEQVAASVGSACHSEADTVSGVLAAMGCNANRARGAVRLSIGSVSTLEEIEFAAVALSEGARDLFRRRR